MTELLKGVARGLSAFTEPHAALDRICEIYEAGAGALRHRFDEFLAGGSGTTEEAPCYPYVGMVIDPQEVTKGVEMSYGKLPGAGAFGTTLTRPDLFRDYYREQLELLLNHYDKPIWVGTSHQPIPLSFVIEEATAGLTAERVQALRGRFALPELSRIDDAIANGTYTPPPGTPKPLSLFSATRVDFSLVRLKHYTATSPRHFQRFVLFTNYQRYVDEFIAYGRDQVLNGNDYAAFVEPGDVVTPNPARSSEGPSGQAPGHLPQMPAYHLIRDDHEGITLVNIGIGPSNAKTITDHIAVLRPHCWLMVGHCGGLRLTQRLGDYVLAHAYVRSDHVLDEDLPDWVPVPPIAEVQIALTGAVSEATGLMGRELKVRLRTGTVFTTDDRDWELRHNELAKRFNQSRAIAVDMESATIAANGFRLRVPYGTLLCVSDKPLHGEIKLPGMADAFYRERISQHLRIGIATLCSLRDAGVESLHSRKLRSFDEPAFR
jgi:AMP nucleosidase